MSSAYAGSVRYYASMLSSNNIYIDPEEMGLNRSWAYNHCRIIGANGVQILTIPVEKPLSGSRTAIKDIIVSDHGDWRRIHWGALFSAYGKSPFFEYIEEDLYKIYHQPSKRLIDFNITIHNLIVDFLDIPVNASVSKNQSMEPGLDLRKKVGEKLPDSLSIIKVEYYQLWKDRFGFIPDLSIMDIMMNIGRETIFILHQMNQLNNNVILDKKMV